MCRYRLRSLGIALASFGAGLVTAKLVPYSVFLVVAAASLILTGTLLCRC